MKKTSEHNEQMLEQVLDLAQEAIAEGDVPFLCRVREISDEFGAGVDLHVYFIASGDVVRLHTHSITSKGDALALGHRLALMTLGITGQLDFDEDDDPPTPPYPPNPPTAPIVA